MENNQQKLELTESQKKTLIAIVHKTLRSYLETGKLQKIEKNDPLLKQKCGAFVTLHRFGNLRGCIGHIQADMPIYKIIQEMAISAATLDPRFQAVTIDELKDITVEISLISPLFKISVDQIKIGVHGLMVIYKGRRGLLLPRVPAERNWDVKTYLDNLCLKAGIPTDIWDDDPELYAFTAIEFGEREQDIK